MEHQWYEIREDWLRFLVASNLDLLTDRETTEDDFSNKLITDYIACLENLGNVRKITE